MSYLDFPVTRCLAYPGTSCLDSLAARCLDYPGTSCLDSLARRCLDYPGTSCLDSLAARCLDFLGCGTGPACLAVFPAGCPGARRCVGNSGNSSARRIAGA